MNDMCKDCERYRKLYIKSLIDKLQDGLDYYEEIKEEYGENHPIVVDFKNIIAAIYKVMSK